MNVDKICGGLGFHILKFKNVEPLTIPRKLNFIQHERNQGKSADWKRYRARVWELTEQVSHLIPGIEKRGFKDHHIDHTTSIWRGYKEGIPAELIGSLSNLRMLPYRENMAKGVR